MRPTEKSGGAPWDETAWKGVAYYLISVYPVGMKSVEKKEELNKIKDWEVRSEESYWENSNTAVSYNIYNPVQLVLHY